MKYKIAKYLKIFNVAKYLKIFNVAKYLKIFNVCQNSEGFDFCKLKEVDYTNCYIIVKVLAMQRKMLVVSLHQSKLPCRRSTEYQCESVIQHLIVLVH